MKWISKHPKEFLSENEPKLRIEYAKLRRQEFYKRGKRYTMEKQAEIITREWTSFNDEQKINM
jgi:hypothetical protein